MQYTVKQLAELTGITVRTLHYYDEIGLLTPSMRTDAEYRLYDRSDLLRLQQILLYRELDFSLGDIKTLLDATDYDVISTLEEQKEFLAEKRESYGTLIKTIEKTIEDLKSDQELITDEELYAGFTEEQIKSYNEEAVEKYGKKAVEDSYNRAKQMTKKEWKELGEESESICQGLAACMDKDPSDPNVQALVKRHFHTMEKFYDVPKERYLGLSELYITDDRFRANYDKYAPGLADFLSSGMKIYAENNL